MAPECRLLRSPLSKYLTNNNSPSDEDINKVKELKQSPSTHLMNVDALILQTQRALDALNEQRSVLQCSIARCDTILSPMRRVPHDIWREIFSQCLTTHRNPIMSYAEAPLLLMHVCSLWRSIALSSPQIWSRIYIPIFHSFRDPILDLPPTHVDRPDIFALTDKMQQRCDLVREWFGRAGVVPLSITLTTQSGERATELHHQLFDIIFHFSPRFQILDLILITMGEAHNRALALPVAQLSELEELRIYSIGNGTQRWYERGLFTAPRLRKLSIGFLPVAGGRDPIFPLPSNWSRLTGLSIGSFMPSDRARRFLLHCPLLAQCSLKIKDPTPGNPDNVGNILDNSHEIHLPRLKDMVIVEDGNSGASLYGDMHVPILHNLECIEIRAMHTFPGPLSILRLLPRLEGLNKLVLNSRALTMDDVMNCFRLVPSVTHLSLGKKADNFNTPMMPPNSSPINILELLVSTYPSEEHPNHAVFLLPKLEILEIFEVSISDKDLLDLIIMRLDPKRQGISRLKHVTGRFSRVKQMDISRQVEYHAKAVGVEFTLDLSWLVKDLGIGLSPSCYLINDRPQWRI